MRIVAALLALLLWASAGQAAAPKFPPLTGRVVDATQVLDAGTAASLDQALAAHEQATGQQVVVATIPTLDDQDIADYGYQLGRAWGIGRAGKNDGALLIVAPHERRVRIEVGYGLEGTLTDAISAQIIQGIILPKFRAGDLPGGIVAGTTAMLGVLRGDENAVAQAGTEPAPDHGGAGFALLPIILLFVLLRIFGGRSGWVFLPFLLGNRGGGGSSGGGFSGGGGSFGGGGSSGSW